MSTSASPERRWLLIGGVILLLGGAGWAFLSSSDPAPPSAPPPLPAAVPAAPAPPPTPPQVAAPTSVAIDLDGDGKADSARIAKRGYYVVDDPIAFKGEGAATAPEVDLGKDAVVVKLSNGTEKAINFSHADRLASLRPGNKAEQQAKAAGCRIPADGRGLLAQGEDGAVLIHRENGEMLAEACGL
ncbi:hypothetical protein [Novosphingobium sp. B 225]|uniref:hypothetical protein n=1 Tax=Novosphingobium sp. B 225 TaxID=1961849 RepID=UPI000B4BFA3E|nr:hypothetical protein [Novosphingobium sp. B 225]